jgi:uncharacterized membrane protein
MTTLLVFYVAIGVVLVLVSIPLLLGKIPPNPYYGFRVAATLGDPKVWYETNRYSAKRLVVAGLSIVLAAVGLWFVPSMTIDAYALGCLAIFAAVFTVGLVQSAVHMKAEARRGADRETRR